MFCQFTALFLVFLRVSYGKIGVSSPTGALLTFPLNNGLLPNMTVTPAEFGIHRYGGFKSGLLVIAADPKYRTQCPPKYNFNSTQEPAGLNPYLSALNNASHTFQEAWILMVDRGDCYFVDKVKHAEALGADAVIVVDNRVEGLVIMWPPESFQQNTVNIPSIFLSETDGRKIYQALGVTGFFLNAPENNLTYPDPLKYPRIRATIEWGLPHPDDVVEWEFWTSSDDKLSPDFFPFGEISENLTNANDAIFTPHYVVLDGTHWGCTAPGLPCGAQCTNGGRFCSEDPERDLQKGITGRAVVQENLRQICVYRYGESISDHLIWWQYVEAFHHRCYDVPHYENTFNEACSFQQLDQFDPSGRMKRWVETCILASGGYLSTSGENRILRNESVLREHSGIYISPTLSINGFHIYGRLSCPLPIEQNTCQAFEAICAGFLEGTEPAICLANEVTCVGKRDCKGVCNGDYTFDACNQCLPSNSTQRGACIDCDGVAHGGKTYDCNNVCGGVAVENRCSICINKTIPNWQNEGADCTGQCGGPNLVDRCGKCLSPLSSRFDNCIGCDNKPGSNKTMDCLHICGGPHVSVQCESGVTMCVDSRDANYKTACSRQGASAGTTGSNNTSVILIVLSVAALLLVLVVLGIMYKNRRDTDARFSQLINQYQPLENDPQHGTATSTQIRDTRKLQEDAE